MYQGLGSVWPPSVRLQPVEPMARQAKPSPHREVRSQTGKVVFIASFPQISADPSSVASDCTTPTTDKLGAIVTLHIGCQRAELWPRPTRSTDFYDRAAVKHCWH